MIQIYENNSLQNVILEGFAVNVYSRTVGGVCAMSGALFVLREIYSRLQLRISKIMIPKTTEPIFLFGTGCRFTEQEKYLKFETSCCIFEGNSICFQIFFCHVNAS